MALLSIFFFLSTIFLVTAQQNNSTINKGSFLTTTSKSMWLSPSGLYAFGFYSESNSYRIGIFIVGVPQKTVVWTIKRDDARVSGDATLKFDTDGQIILQVKQNSPSLLIAQYALPLPCLTRVISYSIIIHKT